MLLILYTNKDLKLCPCDNLGGGFL